LIQSGCGNDGEEGPYVLLWRANDLHAHDAILRGQPQQASSGQLQEYIVGARQFRGMLCGTSALPRPFQEFWTSIRGGKIILTRYGATEFGAVFKVPLDQEVPRRFCRGGRPGLDVKLSNGDEGSASQESIYVF
jgi:malonyl-CoA/methylmalonyl-CoA synthetase